MKKVKKTKATKSLKKLQKVGTVIERVLDLEPLGVLRLNRLKRSGQYFPSTEQDGPIFPDQLKEFGEGMTAPEIHEAFEVVMNLIAYNLFKLEIFKEAYSFEDVQNGWMIRMVHGLNKQPKCCCTGYVPLFDGREEAEVIFFAKSEESARQLQTRIDSALGRRSFRKAVEEAVLGLSDTLEDELFGEDEEIQEFFEQYYPLMVGEYFPNETCPTKEKSQK